MSTFKHRYFFKYDMFYYHCDQEFLLEDVMPYYDLYEDGSIILYIKVIKKVEKWFFFHDMVEEIREVKDEDIYIHTTETPERKTCGEYNE